MGHIWTAWWLFALLLAIMLFEADTAPSEKPSSMEVTTETQPLEGRTALKEESESMDNLDGRSAYVNNQFVDTNHNSAIEDQQSEPPLYEILQKQMEQVLASTGPDVPIYVEPNMYDKVSKRRRGQHPPNKPLFSSVNADDIETEDYDDDVNDDEDDLGYAGEEDADDEAYHPLHMVNEALSIATQKMVASSSPPLFPQSIGINAYPVRNQLPKRRTTISTTTTTTPQPKTTRSRQAISSTKVTTNKLVTFNALNESSAMNVTPSVANFNKLKANSKSSPSLLAQDVQTSKRRIVFKTISTGSQFINSPIGDLIIKFSIGFAKPPLPAQVLAGRSSNTDGAIEALRALSNSFLKSIELQKLRRHNKLENGVFTN